jgi:hypothetical protein
MKILLGDFNAKVGGEDIFKPTISNESSYEITNNNGVAASKNLVIKNTMFPPNCIHKYTRTSPDGKTYNQIEQVLVDRRGIQDYFISDLSEGLVVTVTTIW